MQPMPAIAIHNMSFPNVKCACVGLSIEKVSVSAVEKYTEYMNGIYTIFREV